MFNHILCCTPEYLQSSLVKPTAVEVFPQPKVVVAQIVMV